MIRDQRQPRERGSNTCFGYLVLPFTLLALVVLFLTFNAALVLLWGTEVPGRAERLILGRKRNYELRYSYIVRGRSYQGVTRLSAVEGPRARPFMPLKVRAFAPLPGYSAFVVGWGPSPMATVLAMGALCVPLLLVGSLPLFIFGKGRPPSTGRARKRAAFRSLFPASGSPSASAPPDASPSNSAAPTNPASSPDSL